MTHTTSSYDIRDVYLSSSFSFVSKLSLPKNFNLKYLFMILATNKLQKFDCFNQK